MNAGDADLDETSVSQRDPAQDRAAVRSGGAARARCSAAPIAPREDALARYGMHLGIAFQLVDDVLDYSGNADAIGKNLGDDLAEGKMTLPLIRALATGSAEDAAMIRHAISGGGLTDFAPVMAALDRTGALAYARARADDEVDRAAHCLRGLPDSPYRKSLLELTSFAAQRTY